MKDKEKIHELADQILSSKKQEYSTAEFSILIQSQYFNIEDLFTYGASLKSKNLDDHIEIDEKILGLIRSFWTNVNLMPDSVSWEGSSEQKERVNGIDLEVNKAYKLHIAMKQYQLLPSIENKRIVLNLMNPNAE